MSELMEYSEKKGAERYQSGVLKYKDMGYWQPDYVPIETDVIDKEQELISEELKNSGKSKDIVDKISIGKLNKFKQENSLMSQNWVMDPKKKVKDVIKELNIPELKIEDFARIKIGE